MRRWAWAHVVALVVTFGCVTPAHALVSADPPGTVTVMSGDGGGLGEMFGSTSKGAYWASTAGSVAVSQTGVATPLPRFLRAGEQPRTCVGGDYEVKLVNGSGYFWTNVVTGATGALPALTQIAYPAHDGYYEFRRELSADPRNPIYAIYHHVVATNTDIFVGRTVDPATSSFPGHFTMDACDTQGFAGVMSFGEAGLTQRKLLLRGSALSNDIRTVRELPAGGFAVQVDVQGTRVAYALLSNESAHVGTFHQVVGGVPMAVAQPTGTSTPVSLALNGTTVGISVPQGPSGVKSFVVPNGGAPVAVTGLGTEAKVVRRSSAFLWGVPGDGQYVTIGTSAAATKVWTTTLRSPLQTGSVVMSAGRVSWEDNRNLRDVVGNLWTRPLSTGALSLGPQRSLTTTATTGWSLAGGRRTVWLDWRIPTLSMVKVDNGEGAPGSLLGTSSPSRPALSAHRVLLSSGAVVDVATGSYAAPPAAEWDYAKAVLSGTRVVARNTTTGNLDVKEVGSGSWSAAVTASELLVPSGSSLGKVAFHGDLVAWTIVNPSPFGSTYAMAWKNLRTGRKPTASVAVGSEQIFAYGNVVAFEMGDPSTATWRALDTASGAGYAGVRGKLKGIGPQGVAWADPVSGALKVSPVDQHLVPRHEGNPIAPASFDARPAGAVWRGEWVFTETLTSCAVDIKNASGALVRTLSCDSGYAAQGEAVVAWDGKNATGLFVPSGNYTSVLRAADADGAALGADGVSTLISSAISVIGGVNLPPTYTPLAPSRVLDTRVANGVPGTSPVSAGSQVDVIVAGRGGLPGAGVDSVVLNVTVTSPSTAGYATVFPAGGPRPNASNLNFVAGQTIANQVVAKVGVNGKVSFFVAGGSAHLIADVAGFYPTGSSFRGLVPARDLDTRSATGVTTTSPVPPQGVIEFEVTGRNGVPASGVGAVVLNVTSTESTGPGYLTVFPAGATRPTASNVNHAPGQTIAGMVIAKVGSGGKVAIYSQASSHVIADVAGWIPTVADYTALVPSRILDTRIGLGAPAAVPAGGGTVSLAVTGVGGVPAGVKAVMLNVTVTETAGAGFVTVYPGGSNLPLASNLNFKPMDTIANSVIAKVGADGRVNIFANVGTHVVADVSGYWTQ